MEGRARTITGMTKYLIRPGKGACAWPVLIVGSQCEFDAQVELQQERQPEVRDGEADERADRRRVIEETVLPRGGEDAERNGDQERQRERNPLQERRSRRSG